MSELLAFPLPALILASELNPWLFATGAVIIGLLSGLIGAALARGIILKGREDRTEVTDAARAASIFVFVFFAAIGVIVAVGVTSRDSLRPFPAKLLSYSPHVLAAGLILIFGRALGHALHAYTLRSFSRTSSRLRHQLAEALRFVVTVTSAVLSLRQLGVDTAVLNIMIGAVLFALALAFALLVGFGGRDLGRELAFGRYLHRFLQVGDHLEVGEVVGQIVALHPASVEVRVEDGSSVHITNSTVFTELPRTRFSRPNDPNSP
ncbi:MAG: mechanosensitive ion channel domain-containing protein [Acidimicrobiales bacterium]